jgi:hypothetical protein
MSLFDELLRRYREARAVRAWRQSELGRALEHHTRTYFHEYPRPVSDWILTREIVMRRWMTCAVAAVLLTGCVGQRLEKGLNSLLGQPATVAVARLGYPDGEREIMGDKIYIWSTSHQAALPVTNTSTTTGSVGGVPVYGQTTGTAWVPVTARCTIQLAVDASGQIKHYQYQGNPMGCSGYARMLNR